MRSLRNWSINLLPLLSDISPDPTKEIHRKEASLLAFAFAFMALSGVSVWLARLIRNPGQVDPLGAAIHGLALVVWGAGAWFAHRMAGKWKPYRDPLLLPLGLLLSGWGMLLVWRLSPALGPRQVGWFALGLAILILILRIVAEGFSIFVQLLCSSAEASSSLLHVSALLQRLSSFS